MMDAKMKAKWIVALRSGEYDQAERQLRNSAGGYCCLGVLCDLDDRVEWEVNGEAFVEEDGTRYASDGELPRPLKTWLRISYYQEQQLVHMNDTGSSFMTIAGWIEENL